MWQEIGKLFTTTKIIPLAFIVLGLVFCIIEIFKPQSTVFGMIGGVVIIASLIAVMMLGGSMTHLLFLIITIFIIIILAFCVMTIINEKGIMSKKTKKQLLEYQAKNSLSEEELLNKLVGKIGFTLTELKPNGRVEVNGVALDAKTTGKVLGKNVPVIITKVDNTEIFVDETEIDKQ